MLRIANWHRRYLDPDTKKWRDLLIKGALIIPMYDQFGKIQNVQAIFPEKNKLLDRNKDFLPGGRTAGLFCWVGKRTQTVLVGEGLATCLTIHAATNFRTYVAFSANNLLNVGVLIRKHLPNARIIFCADRDESGTGETKANEAALACGGLIAMPPDNFYGDFNDYANNTGRTIDITLNTDVENG